jgi:hypothetical protein
MENPLETSHKGHTIRAGASRENVTYGGTWKPNNPVIDGNSYTFDGLNFPNKFWNTEEEAVNHSIEYGKWIIDHPTAIEDDEDDEDEANSRSDAEPLI